MSMIMTQSGELTYNEETRNPEIGDGGVSFSGQNSSSGGVFEDRNLIARSRINDVGIMRPKVLSHHSHDHGVSAAPVPVLTDPQMTGELNSSALQPTSSLQIPSSQPIGSNQIPVHQVPQTPTQHTTAFAALAATDEEKEAASMNDSLRKVGFPANLSMFSPEKRQKMEQPSSGADAANLDSGSSPYFTPVQQPISSNPPSQSSMQASLGPPPPPPPPPAMLPANPVLNQYTQSAGMMLNMMPYGFGSNSLPPPPPLPSHVSMGLARPLAPQSSQPLQPPQQLSQQQNASGGFYRPPGIGLYGSSSQPSTPPVQRQ
uniref:Uncharacterized protein n=1 Tax=Chenopodium quinoa TaxID=63459 RepID=A0A803MXZ6_CHEQI